MFVTISLLQFAEWITMVFQAGLSNSLKAKSSHVSQSRYTNKVHPFMALAFGGLFRAKESNIVSCGQRV